MAIVERYPGLVHTRPLCRPIAREMYLDAASASSGTA